MLYNIDKRLCQIMHTPTSPFGNLDIIFCGDLFQAQLIGDSWIFEDPPFFSNTIPYSFWKDNVKCFELKQVMRQDDNVFMSILNRISTCFQTNNDISHFNNRFYRDPPNNPMFPYLFHQNVDVQEHNEKMFHLVQSKTITLNAYDKKIEFIEANSYGNSKIDLPSAHIS